MESGNSTLIPNPQMRPEEDFQRLLLLVSQEAASGLQGDELLRFFCRASQEFFGASGAYFWRVVSGDDLHGIEAEGYMASEFRGARLAPGQSAVVAEAIRLRRAFYVNQIDPQRYPFAARFSACAILAAPLVVFGEVIGALAMIHTSDPTFFNEDAAAKATILAGQMGSLLEATRLNRVSQEEHRKASILMEFAQALPAVPGDSAVVEALAHRLCSLLRAQVVCILFRDGETFTLRAAAAESPALSRAIRERLKGPGLVYAADLARRALAAAEPITVGIAAESHDLRDLVPSGMLLAAPLRTSRTSGAILVYPREAGPFTEEERSLVSAIGGFGAVAIANAELYATAAGQAQEFQQLLEITCELSGAGNLEQFLKKFVVRAAEFLGFQRCFVGLLDGERCEVRFVAESGQAQSVNESFALADAQEILAGKDAFWTEDLRKSPFAAKHPEIARNDIRQILMLPLRGTDGQTLGMFGVLGRTEGVGIAQDDVRRAQALAAQVSLALELTSNLHSAEQHRRRAESLIALSLELNSLLRLQEFSHSVVARAASILDASSSVLLLAARDGGLETVAWHGTEARDKSSDRRLQQALADSMGRRPGPVVTAASAELIGEALASSLGWRKLTVARLAAADGELLGLLCLADRPVPWTESDRQLLQALSNHAAVALQNARLFTRMEQANRHWIEIFDSISDFIVVHDEGKRVLRVNRSLAELVGVPPGELIGLSMAAVLPVVLEAHATDCPFCRSVGDGVDEFLHAALERTFLVSTSRIHAVQHEGLQTIHVLKDVTDRREAERRYRELFDNIQEGLYFSTPDGRFIEVNDALVRMLGYESRDALLTSEQMQKLYFSPDHYDRVRRLIEENGTLRNYQQTLRRKDGSPIHTLQNAFAVRDRFGRVVQFRGLMMDITGLKTFQAELQRERDFSSKILDNTQSLILVVDTAGLISYANRRWAEAGYQWTQLLGRPMEDLATPARRSLLRDALYSTLAGQQVDNLDIQIMRGDGRAGQFSVNLSPMRDEQGQIASLVVVMTDVTDAANLQSKLLHAEKMAAVGQLVSGVAHEVNNPLTAILGFADLLMENPEIPETARHDLKVIVQEAQRTKQIVQNLLSFARQMPPQRQALQLNSILRRTMQLRFYDFQSHGVEVVENLAESLPEVVGDGPQLQQVFLNILNNAYDAVRDTGRPGRIEITTSWSRGFAEASFRDNGEGIVHPDKIFDPFFTTKEVGKGTGLGLSICYGIVREHSGEIMCQNNVGSPGATFVVRLPLASSGASLSAGASSPGAGVQTS